MKKLFPVLLTVLVTLTVFCSCDKNKTETRSVETFTATAKAYCNRTGLIFNAVVSEKEITVTGGNLALPVTYGSGKMKNENIILDCTVEEDSLFNLPSILLRRLNSPDCPFLPGETARIQVRSFDVDITFGEIQ